MNEVTLVSNRTKLGMICYLAILVGLWIISVGPAYEFIVSFDLDVLIKNPQVVIADIWVFIGFFYFAD